MAVRITPANTADIKMLIPMLNALPKVAGKAGRAKQKPEKFHADKAYDAQWARDELKARGIKSRIARKGVESSEKLGKHRWVVERTLSWMSQMRRLVIRYERRSDIHLAFTKLSCCLICYNFLKAMD